MQDPTAETPAKVQNLTQLRAVGSSFVAAGQAARDGIQAEDMGAAMNVMSSLAQAADDLKVDWETGMEEIASQILREVAAYRRKRKGIQGVE